MISFSKLGEYGRFGNQLFQYAFLRTQSKRLGTKFYCPMWAGDKIFNLNDQNEKVGHIKPTHLYVESDYKHGFNIDATHIQDDTEIAGYFQTDKFFLKEDIRKWFSFKEEGFLDLNKKYDYIDFSKSTAIHVRLGDYLEPTLQFYIPKQSYFKEALKLLEHRGGILVFSDNPKLAKKYLNFIINEAIFINGNKDYEDFYLMTKCKNIVCSASSFSWWAAYLNENEDKKVIVPKYWFLPGSRMTNGDIFVNGWIKVPGHRFYDHYYIKFIPIKLFKLYKNFFQK